MIQTRLTDRTETHPLESQTRPHAILSWDAATSSTKGQTMSDTMRHYGDNFIPVIPVDTKDHTDAHPFCPTDPTCPCHEDPLLIAPIAQAVTDGLMTPDEATDHVMGRTLQGGWA